jgi:hypothetical protein
VQLEKSPQEPDDEQQVLLAVGQLLRRPLGVVEPPADVADLVTKRSDALAGGGLADQVGDQQPLQEIALQRREAGGRTRIFAQRLEALVGERVNGALAGLAGSL